MLLNVSNMVLSYSGEIACVDIWRRSALFQNHREQWQWTWPRFQSRHQQNCCLSLPPAELQIPEPDQRLGIYALGCRRYPFDCFDHAINLFNFKYLTVNLTQFIFYQFNCIQSCYWPFTESSWHMIAITSALCSVTLARLQIKAYDVRWAMSRILRLQFFQCHNSLQRMSIP